MTPATEHPERFDKKLIDHEGVVQRGSVLRCTGASPYEGNADLMVIELPEGGNRAYALLVVSGYKAGLILVRLPQESIPVEGYGVSGRWLKNNWEEWVYPDCPPEKIYLSEQ